MRYFLLTVLFLSASSSYACDDDGLKMMLAACPWQGVQAQADGCSQRAAEVLLQGKSTSEMVLYMCTPGPREGKWQHTGCKFNAANASTNKAIKAIADDCATQHNSIISNRRNGRRSDCVDRGLRRIVAQEQLRRSQNRSHADIAH
jgi:hypothetical protein